MRDQGELSENNNSVGYHLDINIIYIQDKEITSYKSM